MDKCQSELRDEPAMPEKTWQERQSEEQRKFRKKLFPFFKIEIYSNSKSKETVL